MDIETLEAKLATIENSFEKLREVIENYGIEQYRLQGEHRVLRELLATLKEPVDKKADTSNKEPTKIEIVEEAQDNGSPSTE